MSAYATTIPRSEIALGSHPNVELDQAGGCFQVGLWENWAAGTFGGRDLDGVVRRLGHPIAKGASRKRCVFRAFGCAGQSDVRPWESQRQRLKGTGSVCVMVDLVASMGVSESM